MSAVSAQSPRGTPMPTPTATTVLWSADPGGVAVGVDEANNNDGREVVRGVTLAAKALVSVGFAVDVDDCKPNLASWSSRNTSLMSDRFGIEKFCWAQVW